MAQPHQTLDDVTVKHDHAKPVHPLRALRGRTFHRGGLFNAEGGLWILLVDALLFVPLVMAAFFYPWQSLLVAIVVLAASFAGYEGWVVWQRRHH